jgi:hypothetical protein
MLSNQVRLINNLYYGIRADSILGKGVSHHIENEEFIDITDFELKSFRYPV